MVCLGAPKKVWRAAKIAPNCQFPLLTSLLAYGSPLSQLLLPLLFWPSCLSFLVLSGGRTEIHIYGQQAFWAWRSPGGLFHQPQAEQGLPAESWLHQGSGSLLWMLGAILEDCAQNSRLLGKLHNSGVSFDPNLDRCSLRNWKVKCSILMACTVIWARVGPLLELEIGVMG